MSIVKVQRPVMPPNGEWLIYDQARKHVQQLPAAAIPQRVKKSLGDSYKGYFEAAWSSIFGWGITKRVKDQEW